MNRNLVYPVLVLFSCLLMLLGGCGGGGSSEDAPLVGVMGIDLPTEISAVPADTGSPAPNSFANSIHKLAVSLPADSDYLTTKTARYVDEPTLEVFGIIETILNAVSQTHYADPENVGAGPYKTIVAWFDEHEGQSEKTLETWIVDSTMPNATTNVVKIWIDDPTEPVMVRATITQGPTQNANGDYTDYGKWSIQASIGAGTDFSGDFYAEADIDDITGETILRLTESFSEANDVPDGQGGSVQMTIANNTKAIMYKDQGTGYGHAALANWDYCWQGTQQGGASPCYDPSGSFTIPQNEVLYGYNTNYLGLQQVDNQGNAGQPTYKNRAALTEIAYRYGLFDATTGQNVEALKTFGFPINFEVNDGQATYTSYGYYGSWQGRHQLWAGPNGTLPNGTTVTEEAWDNSTPASYTTKTFDGSLTRRNLVAADLSQITDLPLEIYLGDGYEMQYDANSTTWNRCDWDPNANGGFGDHLCDGSFGTVNPAVDLAVPANSRKDVNLNTCDQQGACFQLAYDPQTNGFVEVSYDQNGPQFGDPWVPQDTARIWVWVGGQIYIAFDGSTWVEKELVSFDQQTYTPTFGDGSGDTPFTFNFGAEYYINNKGVNFVVSKVADNGHASDFSVEMEIQSVATPVNIVAQSPFLPAGTSYLAYPWDSQQKYLLDTVAANPTYMMLIHAPGQEQTGVVEQSGWGLQAYDASDNELLDGNNDPYQFNWEHAGNGGWGALTYLIDGSGQYVYLDDPIQLDPIQLTVGGNPVNFSLQFDGWMHGLPDMRWELERNNYQMTPQLASKVVNIPAGLQVTDSVTAGSYLIKPLEVGVILNPVTPANGSEPTIPASQDVPLDSFSAPDWVDIGAKPTGLTTKYIEGKAATSTN